MDNPGRKDVLVGCTCGIVCELFYGLSYMFTKRATMEASTFALLGWRFLLAVTVMSVLVLFGIIKINFGSKNIKSLLMAVMFCPSIYFVAETIGINRTTSSESGVFMACIPVASIIASAFLLKKRPSGFQVVGVLTTFGGVVLTVLAVGTSSSLSLVGYLCLMIAVVSYALHCVFVNKSSEFTGAEVTYSMLIAGALIFVSLAVMEAVLKGTFSELLFLPFNGGAFLSAILYQGIGCSIIAFFTANVAIVKIGVNRMSSFIGIATLVSIIAGPVFLKESFTIYQLIGAIIIIVGVYVANMGQKNEA